MVCAGISDIEKIDLRINSLQEELEELHQMREDIIEKMKMDNRAS